jgi:hypothetical protein
MLGIGKGLMSTSSNLEGTKDNNEDPHKWRKPDEHKDDVAQRKKMNTNV